MSYPTEVYLTIKLRKDIPARYTNYIRRVIEHVEYEPLDDHPFFSTERWSHIFYTMGYDFYTPPYLNRMYSGYYELHLHADINYEDEEVIKFVDWISPFIAGHKKKTYLGYKIPDSAHQRTNIYWNREMIYKEN
jgi:hypothetical protein